MPDSPFFLKNPLAAMVLLMTAYTPDPTERLNMLSQTINSMREAVDQINSGINTFNMEVMPMFARPEKGNNNKK